MKNEFEMDELEAELAFLRTMKVEVTRALDRIELMLKEIDDE